MPRLDAIGLKPQSFPYDRRCVWICVGSHTVEEMEGGQAMLLTPELSTAGEVDAWTDRLTKEIKKAGTKAKRILKQQAMRDPGACP